MCVEKLGFVPPDVSYSSLFPSLLGLWSRGPVTTVVQAGVYMLNAVMAGLNGVAREDHWYVVGQ